MEGQPVVLEVGVVRVVPGLLDLRREHPVQPVHVEPGAEDVLLAVPQDVGPLLPVLLGAAAARTDVHAPVEALEPLVGQHVRLALAVVGLVQVEPGAAVVAVPVAPPRLLVPLQRRRGGQRTARRRSPRRRAPQLQHGVLKGAEHHQGFPMNPDSVSPDFSDF